MHEGHQRALCLTNRRLHSFAIKRLYDSLSFNIPEVIDDSHGYGRKLFGLLTPSNPSLQFIGNISITPIFRSATAYYIHFLPCPSQYFELYESMQEILLCIPENYLTEFRRAI